MKDYFLNRKKSGGQGRGAADTMTSGGGGSGFQGGKVRDDLDPLFEVSSSFIADEPGQWVKKPKLKQWHPAKKQGNQGNQAGSRGVLRGMGAGLLGVMGLVVVCGIAAVVYVGVKISEDEDQGAARAAAVQSYGHHHRSHMRHYFKTNSSDYIPSLEEESNLDQSNQATNFTHLFSSNHSESIVQ